MVFHVNISHIQADERDDSSLIVKFDVKNETLTFHLEKNK